MTLAPSSVRAQDLAGYLGRHGYIAIQMTKLSTGHETVKVTINGVEGQFVVDSGAGGTVVHSARLGKFSLQAPKGDGEVSSGAGGQTTMHRLPIRSFGIEGVTLDIEEIRTLDLTSVVDRLKSLAGADIDGVIGQDVLTRFNGVLDVGSQTLFLRATDEVEGR
ncbi:retropepsin-like aspartic protease [Brevundimonas sp.]|uniref:retropepsin-like aspartic protease n=1 Tax=Brevundimonas sp. TaxID=1871086 RepID=UPI0037BE3F6A